MLHYFLQHPYLYLLFYIVFTMVLSEKAIIFFAGYFKHQLEA